MPTYEYRCPNGHEFEEFFRTISSAQAELQCPTCGATAQRRVSGGSGLLFKGSGFYITDYVKSGQSEKGGESKGTRESTGAAPSGGDKPAADKPADERPGAEKKEAEADAEANPE